MRQVYSLTQKTVVWLGEEDADSNQVLEWIKSGTFFHHSMKPSNMEINWGFVTPVSLSLEVFKFVCGRSWFKRIWVIQEFVIGRQVLFLVGRDSFEADALGLGIQNLLNSRVFNCDKFLVESEEGWRVLRIFTLSECRRPPVGSRVLADFRSRDASIPHDKIYGLLGLFTTLTMEAPSSDYDKPFRGVCIEWAKYSLASEKSLEILHSCEGPRFAPDWPSWVPDWSIKSASVVSLEEIL
jgi:hypothetical protein